ncbi:hypothetical protein [Kribbella sp. NPDC006257]
MPIEAGRAERQVGEESRQSLLDGSKHDGQDIDLSDHRVGTAELA